jgi:hypothetical protein
MINWPNGKNFYYHNGWWHGNILRYVTRRKVTIIALSNKYDKRVYKVRKLSALFGIILSIRWLWKEWYLQYNKKKANGRF